MSAPEGIDHPQAALEWADGLDADEVLRWVNGLNLAAAQVDRLRTERDTARSVAVQLEQRNATLAALLSDVVMDYGDKWTDHASCYCSMAQAARLAAGGPS